MHDRPVKQREVSPWAYAGMLAIQACFSLTSLHTCMPGPCSPAPCGASAGVLRGCSCPRPPRSTWGSVCPCRTCPLDPAPGTAGFPGVQRARASPEWARLQPAGPQGPQRGCWRLPSTAGPMGHRDPCLQGSSSGQGVCLHGCSGVLPTQVCIREGRERPVGHSRHDPVTVV